MGGITISVNGASVNKPGGYSILKTSPLTGFPLVRSGIVGIIGPSNGGPPGFAGPFSRAAIQEAKEMYKKGPIADAFDLLVNPSNDERIVNGASDIYVYNVSQNTKSELTLAPAYGVLESELYGLSANQVSAKIENGTSEVLPSLSFTYAPPVADAIFGARINGGPVVNINIVNGDNAAAAATKIDGLTGLSASEDSGVILITVNGTTPRGVGSSLEIYDGGGTNLLSTIGIGVNDIGVIKKSGAERQVQYTLNHPDVDEEISNLLGGEIILEIGYEGTICSLTINDTTLVTSKSGGAGENLNLTLADYNNIQELVNHIDSQTGYSCSSNYAAATTGPGTRLDNVQSVKICSTASRLKPGRIKGDSYFFENAINENSQLGTLTQTLKAGLPDILVKTLLIGGTNGPAANSNFQTGFDSFKLKRINTVVPLIAKDGGSEGYGTYDWDTVAAQFLIHVKWGWSTTGKSERNGYIGYAGTKTELFAKQKTLNSAFISLSGEQHKRVNAQGNLVYLPEWSLPLLVAGLQNGSSIGEPPTYKYVLSSGRKNDNSWDPKLHYSEMISNGILFTEEVDSGGFRVVVGNTTYGKDPNFVWNRISVVEAGGYISYDLRTVLELKYTGRKAGVAVASVSNVTNFVKARMTDYKKGEIIVPDDEAPLGYKNLNVVVEGNKVTVKATVFPVQGVDFLILETFLASATQTA